MKLNKYFDHTFLKPNGTKSDIEKLCKEAIEYDFYSVCVQPSFIEYAKELLEGTDVKVATVLSFPHGLQTPNVKAYEAVELNISGADEIDMVLNYSALLDKNYNLVEKDIYEVRKATDKVLKVIIETSELNDEQIVKATQICEKLGVDFVKTSTGFASGGAEVEDIKLIKKHFSKGIKASGGVSTLKFTKELIKAGATRIGASKSVEIMEEYRNEN